MVKAKRKHPEVEGAKVNWRMNDAPSKLLLFFKKNSDQTKHTDCYM